MCNAQKLPVLVAADTHPECMTGSDSTAYSDVMATNMSNIQWQLALLKFPLYLYRCTLLCCATVAGEKQCHCVCLSVCQFVCMSVCLSQQNVSSRLAKAYTDFTNNQYNRIFLYSIQVKAVLSNGILPLSK